MLRTREIYPSVFIATAFRTRTGMRVYLRRRNSVHEWFASSDLAAPPPLFIHPPRSRNLPRSSTAGCRDAVKVGDAAARLDGTRLHIRSDKLRALRFTRGFLNVYLLHVKHLLSWNLDLLELSDGISTPQGFVNDHILSQVVD